MGVVVHSYGMRWGSKVESVKYPGFTDALDLMRHCHSIGAGGIQTMVGGWAEDFAKKVRDEREKLGMYLEGSIGLPKDSTDLDRFEKEIRMAKEAGATVLRTVCLSGRRYENFKTEAEWTAFKENSLKSIQLMFFDIIHCNFQPVKIKFNITVYKRDKMSLRYFKSVISSMTGPFLFFMLDYNFRKFLMD